MLFPNVIIGLAVSVIVMLAPEQHGLIFLSQKTMFSCYDMRPYGKTPFVNDSNYVNSFVMQLCGILLITRNLYTRIHIYTIPTNRIVVIRLPWHNKL